MSPVEDEGRIAPFPERPFGLTVEKRVQGPQEPHVLHGAVLADGRLQDHDALYASLHGKRRVYGFHAFDELGWCDLPPYAHRRPRHRRWWRRRGRGRRRRGSLRQPAHDAADDTPGNSALDSPGHVEAFIVR